LLTGTASAGIMQNDAPAPAPSQAKSADQEPSGTLQEPSASGIMGNDVADSLTQTALDLLALLPSLL
jgi:hypothetical protein